MGKQIIKYELEDGTEIFIESNLDARGVEYLSSDEEFIVADEKFESLISKVKPVSELIMNSLKDLNNPDEIEVAFGMKFGGKAGIIFASVDSEATFNLKLKWKNS